MHQQNGAEKDKRQHAAPFCHARYNRPLSLLLLIHPSEQRKMFSQICGIPAVEPFQYSVARCRQAERRRVL